MNIEEEKKSSKTWLYKCILPVCGY